MDVKCLWDAQQLVHQLNEQEYSAAIAGGCIRDMLLGYPVKDIDILIDNVDYTDIMHLCHGIWGDKLVDKQGNSSPDACDFVVGVNTTIPLDLCCYAAMLPTLHYVFDDYFDIGLCMVGLNPDNTLVITPAFKSDAEAKRLTIFQDNRRNDNAMMSAIAHAQRLKEKYTDYDIYVKTGLDSIPLDNWFNGG